MKVVPAARLMTSFQTHAWAKGSFPASHMSFVASQVVQLPKVDYLVPSWLKRARHPGAEQPQKGSEIYC